MLNILEFFFMVSKVFVHLTRLKMPQIRQTYLKSSLDERIKMFKIKFNIEKQYAKVSINRNKKIYKNFDLSDNFSKIKRTLGVLLLPYSVNF